MGSHKDQRCRGGTASEATKPLNMELVSVIRLHWIGFG